MDTAGRTFSAPDNDIVAKQDIEESNLLATIQRQLLPEEQERFSYLVEKMEIDELALRLAVFVDERRSAR